MEALKTSFSLRSEVVLQYPSCAVISAASWHRVLAFSPKGLWAVEIVTCLIQDQGLSLSHVCPLRRCSRSGARRQACLKGSGAGQPRHLQRHEVYTDQTGQNGSLKNLQQQFPAARRGASLGTFCDRVSGKSCRSR